MIKNPIYSSYVSLFELELVVCAEISSKDESQQCFSFDLQDYFYRDIFSLVALIIGFRILGFLALLSKTYRKWLRSYCINCFSFDLCLSVTLFISWLEPSLDFDCSFFLKKKKCQDDGYQSKSLRWYFASFLCLEIKELHLRLHLIVYYVNLRYSNS